MPMTIFYSTIDIQIEIIMYNSLENQIINWSGEKTLSLSEFLGFQPIGHPHRIHFDTCISIALIVGNVHCVNCVQTNKCTYY